jgi:HEAT repeat protein
LELTHQLSIEPDEPSGVASECACATYDEGVTRWSLTPEGKGIFEGLYTATFADKRERTAALRRVGELRVPAAIPRLAAFIDPGKRAEAAAALQAIAQLLPFLRPSELRRLDIEVRRQTPYWARGFGGLRPKDVARLRALSGEPVAAAAICSMHRSGYVREAAVREFSLMHDGRELPYLILRAPDWVPEVRSLAQEAVTARLTPAYLPALVSCLALVEGESFATGRASALSPAIDSLLADPGSMTALMQGLQQPDRPGRRAAARRLANLGGLAVPAFVDLALRQDDIVVATIAAESAVKRLEGDALWELLQRLRRHPIGRLRQLALWTALSWFPDAGEEMLREALFDAQGGVRDGAQRRLASQGIDVVTIYRDALPTVPRVALLGLGETGTEADASLAVGYLKAEPISVRGAAVRAVARLDARGHLDALLAALADHSPSVSREARKGLERFAGSVADRVWTICLQAQDQHVRANCFHLLGSLGKWDLLRWGLAATLRPEQDVSEGGRWMVERCLARWNSSFTTPSPGQLEEISALMSSAEAALDSKTFDQLQFGLKHYFGSS